MRHTPTQRKCIHKWCSMLADELNAAGYDFNDGRVVRLPVAFTGDNVFESMFKRVMTALYPDKTSSTQLEAHEVKEIYENMNRFLSDEFQVTAPWPSQESLKDEQDNAKRKG